MCGKVIFKKKKKKSVRFLIATKLGQIMFINNSLAIVRLKIPPVFDKITAGIN